MLDRQIQVTAYLWMLPIRVKNGLGELRRIGVHQPDPFNPLEAGKLAEKRIETTFAVNIETVARRVLADEHQLFHPPRCEIARLSDDEVEGLRTMDPAHERNGTK